MKNSARGELVEPCELRVSVVNFFAYVFFGCRFSVPGRHNQPISSLTKSTFEFCISDI
jgi:hypothetical protein